MAIADQIVIAASTRRLAGNAFELTDLGEHDLKGIAEPVHVWRVERALVTESRFDANRGDSALTPLVGRDEELDLLLRRWLQAKDGEGQVVLLSGEPEIGKSRILGTLRERLEAQGVRALRFQCSPYYVNSAFWPIIDNFERALKFTRDETTDAKLDKLEELIVGALRPAVGRCPLRRLDLVYPRPGALRGAADDAAEAQGRDATNLGRHLRSDRPPAVQRDAVRGCALGRPHHAGGAGSADRPGENRSTVGGIYHRPEFQSRWSGQGHVGALNLSKLTRAQSAAMVSTLASGKALPAALLEQILTRTDGVPLFVEELTKSILKSGELTEDGDHYEYEGSAHAVTIPASLRTP